MKLKYTFTVTLDLDDSDWDGLDMQGMTIPQYELAQIKSGDLAIPDILDDLEVVEITVEEVSQ